MKHTLLILFLGAAAVWADPAAPANKTASPSPFGAGEESAKSLRRISIRGKFDCDLIKIQNGKVWIEHVSFEKPTDLSINGVHWKPQWQGNNSGRFELKLPVDSFDNATVKVTKVQGRSELASVELPTPQNKQTLSIKVVDQPLGVDTYEIHIRW